MPPMAADVIGIVWVISVTSLQDSLGGGRGMHLALRVLDRLDNVDVAGATAQISGDCLADFRFGRLVHRPKQCRRRHHHAGGAEAALEAMFFPEPLLNRIQCSTDRQAFHRRERLALGLDRKHGAGLDWFPVKVDRARAAVGCLAPNVRASQTQRLADAMNQKLAAFRLDRLRFAIDREVHRSH